MGTLAVFKVKYSHTKSCLWVNNIHLSSGNAALTETRLKSAVAVGFASYRESRGPQGVTKAVTVEKDQSTEGN